jgi:hypothetical protein
MSKARVGSGELRPFKKGSCDSESIGGSTSKEHEREGFMKHVDMEKASRSSDELSAFKDSSLTPGAGVNTNQSSVPRFRERKNDGLGYEGEYEAFEP